MDRKAQAGSVLDAPRWKLLTARQAFASDVTLRRVMRSSHVNRPARQMGAGTGWGGGGTPAVQMGGEMFLDLNLHPSVCRDIPCQLWWGPFYRDGGGIWKLSGQIRSQMWGVCHLSANPRIWIPLSEMMMLLSYKGALVKIDANSTKRKSGRVCLSHAAKRESRECASQSGER